MYIDYLIYNTIFKFVVKNEIMKSTFSLSFFLKRTVRNKNGEMPIIGRITVNGNAVEFRPHLSIKSELWSVAKGKAIGRSAEIVQLIQCLIQYVKLYQHIIRLYLQKMAM